MIFAPLIFASISPLFLTRMLRQICVLVYSCVGQRQEGFSSHRDVVTVDGKVTDAEPPTTTVVVVHKPKEFCHDLAGRRTVYDLMPQHWQQFRSVDRLDYMTDGLLLFTNNGALKLKALKRFKGAFCLPL